MLHIGIRALLRDAICVCVITSFLGECLAFLCSACGTPTGKLLLSGRMWVHVSSFMKKCSIMFLVSVFCNCMGCFFLKIDSEHGPRDAQVGIKIA